MTVSKLYALPAERVDGKRQGYVTAVLREGERVCAIKCADENEREFFIQPDDVMRTADAIIYRAEGKKCAKKPALRLNIAGYDGRGNFLGFVEDYVLSSYRIKSCIIGGKSYPFERVCLGDIAIVTDKNSAPAAIAAKDMFLQAVVGGK